MDKNFKTSASRGRPRKVPLRQILALTDLSPRDPSVSTKAYKKFLEDNLKDHREAIHRDLLRDIKTTAQGRTIGASIPPFLVTRPPQDLPDEYASKVTKDTLILIDGYARYAACMDLEGAADLRVSVKEVEAPSIGAILRLAFEANQRNPMPLSDKEKRQHLFRLLLLGEFTEGLDSLHARFPDIGRSTLDRYRKLAQFARKEAQLEGLPLDSAKTALRQSLRDALGFYVAVRYDSKGFPLHSAVKAWREVVETGDVTKWMEQKEREFEERQRRVRLISEKVKFAVDGADPKEAKAALGKLLAEIKQNSDDETEEALQEGPDEDFIKWFGET